MRSPWTSWTFALISTVLALSGCGETSDDARSAELASVFVRADLPLLLGRGDLVAGKYARMASSRYAYHRANVPVFVQDWVNDTGILARSRYHLAVPLVLGTGDPHPENYGILRAADGSLAVEPNDFDGADRLPYLWDVRRLAVGMAVAAAVSNDDDEDEVVDDDELPRWEAAMAARREIAARTVRSYAVAVGAYAEDPARPVPRFTEETLGPRGTSPIMADLFRRAKRDLAARAELDELTEIVDGARRLLRGVYSDDPQDVFGEPSAAALEALPATIESYRRTLLDPPAPAFFAVKDVARVYGKGVASWPRIRLTILVEGPSAALDDDVILELRESTDSGLGGWYPPGTFHDSPQARIIATSRAAWARPDASPLWGTSTFLGFPCQLKAELEGQKTIRSRRMVEDRGTPDAIGELGEILGELQARIHTTPLDGSPTPAAAIWGVIGGDVAGFVAEQADLAVAYSDQILADQRRFRDLLLDLGPTLGILPGPAEVAPVDARSLFGSPPPPPSIPAP